jgi:vacuolar-type H+-ATPase subunit C/Vma6
LNNPREAIDALASMGFSFAQPLLNMRAEMPGAETFEMELVLNRWYYEDTRQTLRSETGLADPLSHALALEIDLANVLTALRFAHDPRERDHLRERLGTDDITRLFLGPGRIPHELLANACKQDTVASAIEILSGTFFGPVLRAGLEAYAHSSRLSDIEKRLKHYRLEWMAGQITNDPLGIGIVFGYVALKVNEIGSLRWIAQGVNLGLKSDAIRAELEVVV